MKLNGVVTSCTQYAAFVRIEPKVKRASKGDRFVEVTGLMHVSDMEGYKPEVIINSMGKKETIFRSKEDKNKCRKTMDPLEDSDDDDLDSDDDASAEGDEEDEDDSAFGDDDDEEYEFED